MTDDSSNRPPTPRGVPLLGNILDAWRDPLDLFVRVERELGPVARLRFAGIDYYVLHDPDHIHHALVDGHRKYTKSRNYVGLKAVVGEGLLTSEGDFWRRQRKLAQPAFHRNKLAGFVGAMVDDTASMLERWGKESAPWIDLHKEMMHLTFRIVGRTLFSTDIEGEARAIGEALTEALVWANRYAQALVHVPTWVPTAGNMRFRRAMKTLDALVYRIIADRRDSGEDPGDLLGMLMNVTDEATRETMTDRQLRDEVMTLVLAGHETTANLLSWTFYLLSKHPDVARKVRAEVREVLGERTPALEDVGKLAYTKTVLEEALRLYPPAWVFEREAVEDDEIGGYRIAKGTIVAVSPWSLHRSTRLWDNPEGFDPERFGASATAARPKFAYLPFGGGPRLCIGNAFAMMEAQLILATVFQRYRPELVAGHPVEAEPLVTLRPRHGMRMWLRPVS